MRRSGVVALLVAIASLACDPREETNKPVAAAPPPAAEPETAPSPPAEPGTAPAQPAAKPETAPETAPTPAAEPGTVPAQPVADSGTAPAQPVADPGTAPPPADEPGTAPPPPAAARIAFVSDRSGEARIYLANPDGSGVTPLTTGDAPAWSADGRKIAFRRPGSGIYVIDANGANERFLRAGGSPTWSPDGTRIAFSTGSGTGGGVHIMNADGSNATLLVSNEFASPGWGFEYGVFSPAWSPDGQRIAFVRANYDEGFAIYTTNADGSGSPTPLPGNGFAQDRPAWSPDGSRVAFETGSYSGDEVASVTLSGSDFRVHVTNETGYAGDPAWSPDGRSLLFTRNSPRGTPTRISIVREDGSVGQLIPEAQSPANSDYRDRDPAWSWTN